MIYILNIDVRTGNKIHLYADDVLLYNHPLLTMKIYSEALTVYQPGPMKSFLI